MAVIKSGATSDQLTIDPISKAARVTLYDANGRETSLASKRTYAVSGTFTPAATPTDLVTIIGSGTTTIRVLSLIITTTTTATASHQFFLIKRSTVDTGGTFVSLTPVSYDSDDAAATAVAGHWTANPSALGTVVGTLHTMRVASPVPVPGSFAGIVHNAGFDIIEDADSSLLSKAITLRGVTQQLALNYNGVALVAGQTHAYRLLWIEE